jgi:hypothetical protein
MLAMLALTSSNQTDWRNFTDRAIVSNDGTAVRLAASFPVEESINLLDSKSARDDELQADEDDPPDAGKSP